MDEVVIVPVVTLLVVALVALWYRHSEVRPPVPAAPAVRGASAFVGLPLRSVSAQQRLVRSLVDLGASPDVIAAARRG